MLEIHKLIQIYYQELLNYSKIYSKFNYEELLHISFDILLSYDLDKLYKRFKKDEEFFYYMKYMIKIQASSNKSKFNKMYNNVKFEEYMDEEIGEDDYNSELCFYLEKLDDMKVRDIKKYFLKYLYTEIFMYGKNVNEVIKELNTKPGSVYIDYHFLVKELKKIREKYI